MIGIVIAAATAILLAPAGHRLVMRSRMRRAWTRLALLRPAGRTEVARFDPAVVEELPEAARRWLLHAIAPGAALASVALLRMHGTLQLKRGAEPLAMEAEQVLAPPHGYIWRAHLARGATRIRGWDRYDSGGVGELRWWLYGLAPVAVRRGPDVARSAAGRLAGESVLIPSSLLPGEGVTWESVDASTARVRRWIDGEEVLVTIRVAEDGRLERVLIRRWNGDRANGSVGYLPFVVDCEDERTFGGYTVPAVLRAGWASEAADATGSSDVDGLADIADGVEPFFVAELDSVRYL